MWTNWLSHFVWDEGIIRVRVSVSLRKWFPISYGKLILSCSVAAAHLVLGHKSKVRILSRQLKNGYSKLKSFNLYLKINIPFCYLGVRQRWRVGAGCNPVAVRFSRFDSYYSHKRNTLTNPYNSVMTIWKDR